VSQIDLRELSSGLYGAPIATDVNENLDPTVAVLKGRCYGRRRSENVRLTDMTKLARAVLTFSILTAASCHPGPVIAPGDKLPVGGTIAGIVSDGSAAVPGRKVTAIDVAGGTRYEATTGANGGYTIKVPEGTYRLEVELRPGEVVLKQPDQTRVNKSDLDPRRDFTIAVKK
jgi:hypothetical protein